MSAPNISVNIPPPSTTIETFTLSPVCRKRTRTTTVQDVNTNLTGNFQLTARVVSEPKVIKWASGKGEHFVVILEGDESKSQIQVTGWHVATRLKFMHLFKVGHYVTVYNAQVKTVSNTKFNKTGHDYELAITAEDDAIDITDLSTDESYSKKFKLSAANLVAKISDLVKYIDQDVVFVGVVLEHSDPEMQPTKAGKSHEISKMEVCDETGTSVKLTLWGVEFQKVMYPPKSLVLIRGFKVGSYNTCSLSGWPGSASITAYDSVSIPTVKELEIQSRLLEVNAWKNLASTSFHKSQYKTISSYDPSNAAMTRNIGQGSKVYEEIMASQLMKAIYDAKSMVFNYQQKSGVLKVPDSALVRIPKGNYKLKGTISGVYKAGERAVLYKCCPKDNKGLDQDGKCKSDSCGEYYTPSSCNYGYLLSLEVNDQSGHVPVFFFDSSIKNLLGGISAKELLIKANAGNTNLGDNHYKVFNETIIKLIELSLTNKKFEFYVNSQPDSYEGLKLIGATCQPINFDQEVTSMIEAFSTITIPTLE